MVGRVISALGVLVVCLFVVVGCGGGGGSDTTGGGGGETTSAGKESTSSGSNEGSDGGESSSGGESEGGSANPTTGSGKPMKKSQFIVAGDTICGKVPAGYEQLIKKLKAEQKQQGAKLLKGAQKEEETLKAAVPPLWTAAEKFSALVPPKGDEGELEAIIEALEAAADELEKNPNLPLTGPKSPFVEFAKLTSSYGFKVCPEL